MSPAKPFLWIVSVALVLPYGSCWAAEDGTREKAAQAPSADELAAWIRQLDADDFSERETASQKLAAAGKAAAAALGTAATGDSLEASTRAMKILRKWFDSDDADTKAVAKEALEKVARSNHPSAARRAREAIEPKQPVVPPAIGPGVIVANGVITLNAKSVSVSNVNGVKTIKVSDGDKKIKIHDDPNQGIKVEITETKNGKQVTKTTEAKNADELKKKDARAHEAYEQYGQGKGGGGVIQFQIQAQGVPGGGIQIMPQIQPAVPVPVQPLPVLQGISPAQRIEAATRQLQRLGKQLEAATTDAKDTEKLREAVKQFREELQRQLADVEKKLKEIQQRAE